MKWGSLILVLFGAACDPGVRVEFLVNATDDSTAQASAQIADALAQRHGLGSQPLDSSCDLASYHVKSAPTRWWDFCVDQRGQNVSLVLEEWITTDWSPKGDSLQRELEDTLRIRFGDRVTRHDYP